MHKLIELGNGVKLVDFTPEDNQPKGIVHIATIQRLAELLPMAPQGQIIKEFVEAINRREYNLQAVIEVAESFVNFHRTVNLIREYKPEPDKPAHPDNA